MSRASSKQVTMLEPGVVDVRAVVDKHVRASPVAYGPRAVIHSGMSTSSSTEPVSSLMAVQAEGSDDGQLASSADVRQLMIESPVTVVVSTSSETHVNTLPLAKTPRLAVHVVRSTAMPRPTWPARSSQEDGRDTAQALDDEVGQAIETVSVVVEVGLSGMSRASNRQSTMLEPVVEDVIDVVDKQSAALPTAKGPSWVTQSGTSTTRSRPSSSYRARQESGSSLMQVSASESVRQSTIDWPVVVRSMLLVKHVRVLPVA